MTERALLGLERVGPARPVDRDVIEAIAADAGLCFPPSYVELMCAWGPGALCGWMPVLDPTDDAPWAFWRRFMKTDGLEQRRQWGSWNAVDEATFERLVVFADLDGQTLAFDSGASDGAGELPIWLLDREGQRADLVGRSMAELVERFLLGGELDARYPPARGGAWGLRPVYTTWPRAWIDSDRRGGETVEAWWERLRELMNSGGPPPFGRAVVVALARGDEAEAQRMRDALYDVSCGYEALGQLLQPLLEPSAHAIAPALHARWLEQTLEEARRFHPDVDDDWGVSAKIAALR